MFCLKYNKPDKQNVYDINLFQKFSISKKMLTQIDVRNALQLTANCIAPIRYLRLYIKVIKNLQPQRTQKFPLSLTLLSFKTRIELPPVLTTTTNFPSVHFQLLEYSRQSPSFSAHRATLMTKLSLFFQHFLHVLQISQFNSAFAVSFHSTRTALESSLTVA